MKSTTSRQSRQIYPATGTVRWLRRPGCGKPGLIVITVKNKSSACAAQATYAIEANTRGGRLLGYRLRKGSGKDAEVYDVDESLASCSCPDSLYRGERAETKELCLCKHCKSLARALAVLTPRELSYLHF